MLATGLMGIQAQAQALKDYQVKAAFVFNFAKFVDWPSDAFSDGRAPLVLGVIGNDPFGGALDQVINGQSIGGRLLVVRRLKWGQDLRSCHILFIGSSEQKRLTQITQQGGIINFILEASKIRFEINLRGANQARLRISSKLLALSKTH
jgi:hypothetical protein